ncbi:MAG: GatB/YqeY domain-containing protein [Eggerthellaceae bacterium]
MTYDELKERIKDAMKARDKDRLRILRQLHGEIKQIEIDERREITEQDVTEMTKRVLKQTREMLENSIKAANDDERTERLRFQVKVLEDCLPAQLSGDELVKLVEKTIADLGATTKRDMGKVMGALSKATNGNLDKAEAAKEVGKRLS